MKVDELIALLQTMPQDLEVVTEGCDCTGYPRSVEIFTFSDGKQIVEIKRDHNQW